MANVLNEGRSVFAAPFAFKISLTESVHIANLLSVQGVVVAALFSEKRIIQSLASLSGSASPYTRDNTSCRSFLMIH
jgi:hypothetical protein